MSKPNPLSPVQRRAAEDQRKAMRRKRTVAVETTGPLYPNVVVRLTGTDGNAMNVVGRVRRALDKAGVPDDVVETFVRKALSGDYDNMLQTCMRWVEVE